jgi:hypothetical protein
MMLVGALPPGPTDLPRAGTGSRRFVAVSSSHRSLSEAVDRSAPQRVLGNPFMSEGDDPG